MKNKTVRGILALVVVTALSFGVILGSKALAKDTGAGAASQEAKVLEELDTKGAENIQKAVKTDKGYVVTVKKQGYASDIVMKVSFDKAGETVTAVEVTDQNETEGLGAKIADAEFLSQFEGVKAPVVLPGMKLESDRLKGAVLEDGTYEVKGEPMDGYTDQVSMTVKEGKITEVVWESVGEDGSKKSVLSETGEYVMTEDGLTWKEQAEAMAAALVENQSLEFANLNEQGKTDAVSGVSISVGGFVNLAQQCMNQAAGIEEAQEQEAEIPAEGTQVDAISGATVSSTAAVTAINDAYAFLQTLK